MVSYRSFRHYVLVALLVAVSSLVVLPAPKAYGCSCIPPAAPQEEMERSAAVFAGTVSDIQQAPNVEGGPGHQVTFTVSEVWKGPVQPQIVVATAQDSAACGYQFEPGRDYIVYAYEADAGLATGLCSRTAARSDAQEDLAALGEGDRPAADTAQEPAGGTETAEQPNLLPAIALTVVGLLVVAGIIATRRRRTPTAS